MYASELRAAARRALTNRWPLAIVAGLLVRLLCGTNGSRPSINLTYSLGHGVQPSISLGNLPAPLQASLVSTAASLLAAALLMSLLYFTIGSVVQLGYARFNLSLIDGGEPQLPDLFACFSWFRTAFCARFLTDLYTLLWSLLLIFPGIYAALGYAMTPYLLAEHPELTAREAIQRSKALMEGHRWDLFLLNLSFIGWAILCALTMGFGSIFLNPYIEAAHAAFYRSLTGSVGPLGPDL